jgi:hypothetical protein
MYVIMCNILYDRQFFLSERFYDCNPIVIADLK